MKILNEYWEFGGARKYEPRKNFSMGPVSFPAFCFPTYLSSKLDKST